MQRSIYTQRLQADQFEFRSNRFHGVLSKETSRQIVSVLEGGRLGIATGTMLSDAQVLTSEARGLCRFSRVVDYDFPVSGSSRLAARNTEVASIRDEQIVEFCETLIEALVKRYPGLTVDVTARRMRQEVGYENSLGVEHRGSEQTLTYGVAVHRSSEEDLFIDYRGFDHQVHTEAGAGEVEGYVERLEQQFPIVEFTNGDYPALLTAWNLEDFLTGFWQALDGKRLYEKQSPLCGRFGERLFDKRFSLSIEPQSQGTGGFDVEGVAAQSVRLVQEGVLRGGLYDLEYAQKCDERPSGLATGNLRMRFQTVPVSMPFGTHGLDQMMADAGRGLLILHCGEVSRTTNLKGDFSCGLDALYFDGGLVRGRVKNLNMAANVFDLLRDGLVDLGSEGERSPSLGVTAPHLHFRSLSFTA
jgi:predicted Zn-dependent protease